MIPYEATNQFHDIITHEMVEMDRKLAGALQATERSMFSRGLGQSGNAMHALAEHATNSLKARAYFIFDQLRRCLSSHYVALSPEVLTEALTLLRAAIEDQAQVVETQLFKSPSFCSAGCGQTKLQLQSQYSDEGPRLLIVGWLSTELKLAAAAANGSPALHARSLNFHGPVGLVQTGHGSQATVHQQIDAGVRNEIASTLQLFLEQLDRPENSSLGNGAELRELIAEAKAEAEKPEGKCSEAGIKPADNRGDHEIRRFLGTGLSGSEATAHLP